MNFGIVGVVGIAVLLCGCSDADWNDALSYNTAGPSNTSAPQAASANVPSPVDSTSLPPPQADAASPQTNMAETAVPPQPSYSVTRTVTTVTHVVPANPAISYCRQVAKGSGAVATRDGDDDVEQQHAVDATYQECLHLYGATDP